MQVRYAARHAQEVGLPTVGVVASYEKGWNAVMRIDVGPVDTLWEITHKSYLRTTFSTVANTLLC